MLVTMILICQFILCTLAAFAFARFRFPGRSILFALVLLQLLVMPDILIVENYKTIRSLGLVDTIVAIGLPYITAGQAHLSCLWAGVGKPSLEQFSVASDYYELRRNTAGYGRPQRILSH